VTAGITRRLALAGLLPLASCSLLPSQPYTERRDWPLVIRRPVSLPPRRNGKVLLVRQVSAAPELDSRGLQWLRRDGSVHTDYYEQWAVAPADAVDDDLRQWLASSGLYAAVLSPGSRVPAGLVLEAELTTFIADFPAGLARAALAVVLLDQRLNPPKVKLQHTFSATAELAGDSIPSLVDASRAALARVFEATERGLARA
jgi:ABC-type uncharacterized transport system auxiliary subunit